MLFLTAPAAALAWAVNKTKKKKPENEATKTSADS